MATLKIFNEVRLMSTASIRSSSLSAAGSDNRSSGAAMWWTFAAILLALLAFCLAWFFGWIRFTTDPRVLEIRALQDEAREKFVASGGPANLVQATETVIAMGQIRQKVQSLPKDLRSQVESSGSNMFRSTMRARIDGYFALPPEKRQAELDRQIKQEDMMRKAFETAGAVLGAFGGGGNANGGGTGRGTDQQAGASAPGGPPRGGSEEGRNNWRKNMIDRTTPEQRARYVEYRRSMEDRRTQLGLPSSGPR